MSAEQNQRRFHSLRFHPLRQMTDCIVEFRHDQESFREVHLSRTLFEVVIERLLKLRQMPEDRAAQLLQFGHAILAGSVGDAPPVRLLSLVDSAKISASSRWHRQLSS